MRQRIVLLLFVFGGIPTTGARGDDLFPRELVDFVPYDKNPVFTGAGPGHWDAAIRERGWILKDEAGYRLWYTGYDGTKAGIRRLGYATSNDGICWTRHPEPLDPVNWIEDMMVVRHAGAFYMFAEGLHDRAQLLTSKDGVHWERKGTLDIRKTGGTPISPGPFGTPTAWFEKGEWFLLFERMDLGVWLATSKDLKVWRQVQDEPVMVPGPAEHESVMIAVNQVIRRDGRYYAYYHGRGKSPAWSTNLAASTDLKTWWKYPHNPLLPAHENKSSGILSGDGQALRLYAMHPTVSLYLPRSKQ